MRRVSVGSEADGQQSQSFQENSNNSQKIHIKCPGGMSSESDGSEGSSHKKVKEEGTAIKMEIKEDPDYCGEGRKFEFDEKSNIQAAIPSIGLVKRRKSDDGNSMCSSVQDSIDLHSENSKADASGLPRKKSTLRTQLAQQIMNTSNKTLKKPVYPVRPASTSQPTMNGTNQNGNYVLDPTVLLLVFKHLPIETLTTCSLVCKTWSNVSVDPSLWKKMNCSQYKLSASLLIAIVRRQPENLNLDWTSLAKRQLSWMIARMPALKTLSLQGTPIQSIFGLHTCLCPPLNTLDLSFVRGLNDHAIREILSPPKDSRPGTDSKSRLRNLRTLKVAGTDISDVALRYLTQGLPYLVHLDLSSCQRITDVGVAQIGTSASAIKTLYELDLSSCKLITEVSLDYLAKCESLTRLDLRFVPQVSTQSLIKFAAKSNNDLQVQDVKLVDKRKV